MSSYITLDYLSPYIPTAAEMASARTLTYSVSAASMSALGYEREAVYSESGNYASLRDLFIINLTEGATYYIYSSSYFDPFILSLHDASGKFIAVDGGSSYGSDTITYIAPYTGVYYINASWDQGAASGHKFVYLSVNEDADTSKPIDRIQPTVTTFSPSDEAIGVNVAENIVVVFSEAIQRGTGNIVMKTAAGATVATYDATTSANFSISGSTLTINPSGDLSYGTGYRVEFALGTIKDLAGNGYAGSTNYNFNTLAEPVNQTFTGSATNESFTGGTGNDTIDGGSGTDIANFSGNLSAYTVTRIGSTITVQANFGTDGTDTLFNIERLQFSDKKLALDLTSNGNAGKALEFIGMMAHSLVHTPNVVGTILSIFDQGKTMKEVCQLAIDVGLTRDLAGSTSNLDLAKLVFRNVVGSEASAGNAEGLASYIQGNGGSMTQADFLATVAQLDLNNQHIGLVGLQQTGVEYII